MLFVCENEKQGIFIHIGVSMALNFLHLEGQARLRSSGIDAALIWYLIIWIWFLSRISRMALVCENFPLWTSNQITLNTLQAELSQFTRITRRYRLKWRHVFFFFNLSTRDSSAVVCLPPKSVFFGFCFSSVTKSQPIYLISAAVLLLVVDFSPSAI